MTAALELNIDAMPYPPLCDGQFLLRPGQAAKFLGISTETFNSLRLEIPFIPLPGCCHPRYAVTDLIDFASRYRVDAKKTLSLSIINQKNIAAAVVKILEREKAKIKKMPASRLVKEGKNGEK